MSCTAAITLEWLCNTSKMTNGILAIVTVAAFFELPNFGDKTLSLFFEDALHLHWVCKTSKMTNCILSDGVCCSR